MEWNLGHKSKSNIPKRFGGDSKAKTVPNLRTDELKNSNKPLGVACTRLKRNHRARKTAYQLTITVSFREPLAQFTKRKIDGAHCALCTLHREKERQWPKCKMTKLARKTLTKWEDWRISCRIWIRQ